MPDRPRSHVIEDIAETRFKLAMQPRWIVRSKDKDYGVDLEAELLGDDGDETGNLFYVQSKATDDEKKARSVQMDVDRLNYLISFDVPSMIIRYCVPTDTIYWIWATEARAMAKPEAKTVTIKFDDSHLWVGNTVGEIERTLPILKVLKSVDSRTSFPLQIDERMRGEMSITAQRLIDRLSRNFSFMVRGNQTVPIKITINENEVQLSIERIISITACSKSNNIDHLECVILYLLANVLEEFNHTTQGAMVARRCLEKGAPAPNDYLAAIAAVALLKNTDADKAVDLAILNNLHVDQNFGHAFFRMALTAPFTPKHGLNKAVKKFYELSIAVHEAEGTPIGAIRYSYGNYLVSIGEHGRAAKYFNGARHDEPDYWNRAYFLRALGGLLFRRQRYSASARAYQCAYQKNPNEQTEFCLADAELYAGNFVHCSEIFDRIAVLDSSRGAEARLKRGLADWANKVGITKINDWNTLHPLRENALTTGNDNTAFWAHIALSFHFEDDVECWADAIFLALFRVVPELIEDVMLVAASRTHLEAYAEFKRQRSVLLQADEVIETELDRIALAYNEQVKQEVG